MGAKRQREEEASPPNKFTNRNMNEIEHRDPAIELLKVHLNQQYQKTKEQLPKPFMFSSSSAKLCVNAYNNNSTIEDVPLERRGAAKVVFKIHLKNYATIPTSPLKDRYTPLLCNHGVRGSGKSVQQAFNMLWFLNHFSNGIAIEITFNDDCDALGIDPTEITSQEKFKITVVKGIILRLVEYCYGIPFSSGDSSAEMNEYLKSDYSRWFLAGSSIREALKFVRQVLGLPDDTPILLAVDELAKLLNPKRYLSTLCGEMDASFNGDIQKTRKNRSFWLSVSGYGCFSLLDFVTGSNRPLNLQPLPPIFPVVPEQLNIFEQLPPILQIFKPENRLRAPFTQKYLEFYKTVTEILMISGGHPRRISRLLMYLNSLSFDLNKWNKTHRIPNMNTLRQQVLGSISEMDEILDFDGEYNLLTSDVCKDLVNKFDFGTLGQSKHQSTRQLLEEGLCSYLPISRNSKKGTVFIPYPVLLRCEEKRTSPLEQLSASMVEYFRSTGRGGKELESCVCDSLNFFATHATEIHLNMFCRYMGDDAKLFNLPLHPLQTLPASTVDVCPSYIDLRTNTLNCIDTENLSSLAPGFYLPREKFNLCCDIIGIMDVLSPRRGEPTRLLLFIQLKDWFKDGFTGKHIISEWRWGQQFVLNDQVPLQKNSNENVTNPFAQYWKQYPKHKPVFMLFSANQIDCVNPDGSFNDDNFQFHTSTPDYFRVRQLMQNEATLDLDHAKEWFPTFGYNLLAGHKLRQLWPKPTQ